jgi:hypothetical protein
VSWNNKADRFDSHQEPEVIGPVSGSHHGSRVVTNRSQRGRRKLEMRTKLVDCN